MKIREEVREWVALGPLPNVNADEDEIALHENALRAVHPPLTDEEARLLVRLFGPDECYGLAWSLLHLIESAPSEALLPEEVPGENEWVRRLRQRAQR